MSAAALSLTAAWCAARCTAGNVEQLRAAFKGAHGVFAMTAPVFAADTKTAREAEVRIGKNIADAAKAEGVQHLIWRYV